MNKWTTHLRNTLTKGLIWSAAWFGAGIVLARVSSLEGDDLPFAILFAPLGFVAGMVFFGMFSLLTGHYGLQRMPGTHFAGWGAVSGLLLSTLLVVSAAFGGDPLGNTTLVLGPLLAMAGTLCAAAALAAAKRHAESGIS